MLRMNYHYTRADVTGMGPLRAWTDGADPADRRRRLQQISAGPVVERLLRNQEQARRLVRAHVVQTVGALLRGFRQFSIPMPLHMIRMVRATLLYDTVAAQLDPKIKRLQGIREILRRLRAPHPHRHAGSRHPAMSDRAGRLAYVKVRRIVDIGNALLFRAEKFLAEPENRIRGGVTQGLYADRFGRADRQDGTGIPGSGRHRGLAWSSRSAKSSPISIWPKTPRRGWTSSTRFLPWSADGQKHSAENHRRGLAVLSSS